MMLSLPFTVKAQETEVDLNLVTDNQFFQFRNGVWAWDWHFEAYQNLGDKWRYGLIYQGREGKNLEWHQLIYRGLPPLLKTENLTINQELKANFIPTRSVGPDDKWGLHYRVNAVQRLSDKLNAQLFLEPRWQGDEYFGHKSRFTFNYKFSDKTTGSFGWTWYGTSKDKWTAEEEWVVMLTVRL